MTQNKLLPFDMEEILKTIRDTPTLRALYKKMLSKVESHPSAIADITFSAQVTTHDIWTTSDLEGITLRLKNFLSLLPENTLSRKHISEVAILDTHWFRRDATYENLNDASIFPHGPLTSNPEEYASPFSLPWGMKMLLDDNPYKNKIIMYMPIETYPIFVIDIYLAYTAFHEMGHVFSDAAYYSLYYAKRFLGLESTPEKRNTYTLTLPNDDQISGNEYVSSFAILAEKYGPFGSYTAGYKKEDDAELWLRESFADATAAYFMGFMMYPEKDFAPLHPEVQQYIHDFYHAVASIKRA